MDEFSLTESSVQTQKKTGAVYIQAPGDVTDLSLAMQKALNKFFLQEKNLLLRFDPLPIVALNAKKCVTLCYLLLQAVFSGQKYAKLLLSIKCEELGKAQIAYIGYSDLYRLSIQTNFSYNEAWYQKNRLILKQCEELLKEYGGRLELNIRGAGCLFWVIFPGKYS